MPDEATAIQRLADRLRRELSAADPAWRAEAGLDADEPQDDLPDVSPAGWEVVTGVLEDAARGLALVAGCATTPEETLTVEVLRAFLDIGLVPHAPMGAGRGTAIFHDPLGEYSNAAVAYEQLVTSTRVGSVEQAEGYFARLAGAGTFIDGVLAAVDARTAAGLASPAAALASAVEVLEEMSSGPPERSRLYEALADQLSGGWAEHVRSPVLERAASLIEGTVWPAYVRLAERARADLPHGREELGLCALPGGDEAYGYLVRAHTTTTLTPEQVHALGLEEVERLHDRIRERFAALGMHAEDVGDLYRALSRSPELRYPEGDAAAVLGDVRSSLAEVEAVLRPSFTRWPAHPCRVEAVPQTAESSMPTHALSPRAPGEGGTIVVNLRQALAGTRAETRVLTFHEGLPGHVLQLSIAQTLDDVPAIRRSLPFHAYTEGWGKYAELLPLELGLDDDPHLELARLRFELFSTSNLVADTGFNLKGWARSDVAAYTARATGDDHVMPVAVAARALTWPGHLLSYKIGLLEFLRVRSAARERLGAAFDLRAFHDAVLHHGSLPLTLLDAVVSRGRSRS